MTEEQNKEVMRLADEIADYAWREGVSDGAYTNAKDDRECRADSRTELEAYLRTIGEPENTFPLNPNGASKWARLQKHDGAEAIGVVFRTGSGSVIVMIKHAVRIQRADTSTIVDARRAISTGRRLLKTVVSFLRVASALVLTSNATSVVVLTPPAVPTGDPPMNIKVIARSAEACVRDP